MSYCLRCQARRYRPVTTANRLTNAMRHRSAADRRAALIHSPCAEPSFDSALGTKFEPRVAAFRHHVAHDVRRR